MLSSIDRKFNY